MGAYEADPESTDCNANSIPDACDISCEVSGCSEYQGCGASSDSEPNGIPDECEVQSESLPGSSIESEVDLAAFGLVCRCLGSPATGDCAGADFSGDGYVDEDDVIAWQAAQLGQ